MDEDNGEVLHEPIKINPQLNKQVDADIYQKIKKKAENATQRTYKDVSYGENENEEEIDEEELRRIREARLKEEERIRKEREEAKIQKEKELEKQKTEYKEIAEKVQQEKIAREERLENMKIQKEEKHPNTRGELLKSLAYIIFTIIIIVAVGLLLLGNFKNAFILVITAVLIGGICLGLAEIIHLLQKIYDLMYYLKNK